MWKGVNVGLVVMAVVVVVGRAEYCCRKVDNFINSHFLGQNKLGAAAGGDNDSGGGMPLRPIE